MFRIMILLFFRLMTIDMTLIQFIDWFLEQFEEDEDANSVVSSNEDIDLETRVLREMEKELLITKSPERRKEIEGQMDELRAQIIIN